MALADYRQAYRKAWDGGNSQINTQVVATTGITTNTISKLDFQQVLALVYDEGTSTIKITVVT